MKPIVLGLSGSIAMGKSTLGEMLVNMGIPVHEADKAAHRYLQAHSPARSNIAAAFPPSTFPDLYDKKTKSIDRKQLGDLVFANDAHRQKLESILHPLIWEEQKQFISRQGALGQQIVCLDIPLLFETGLQDKMDYTLVVSASAHIQRKRALARDNMSEEKLDAILKRQMSNSEKCKYADYVIETGLGRAHSMKLLKRALLDIQTKNGLPLDSVVISYV